MSLEIEAKMRVTDEAALLRQLESLNAPYEGELTETNIYFDTSQRLLKSSDQGLRIRTEQLPDGSQRVTLTHKGPRAHGHLKSRSETQVSVDDAGEAAALLRALGYTAVLSFEKRRRRWRVEACHVDLDTLPYLGQFVEIEGPSDEAVLSARAKLGLAQTPLVRASYIAMLASYVHEHQLATSAIRFEDDAEVA